MKPRAWTAALLLTFIGSGCAGSGTLNNPADRIHVITQICLRSAKGTSNDVVWLDPVTRVGYGVRAVQRMTGLTTTHQPVFETYAAPPTDIVGIVIFLSSDRATRLIFVPPRSLPTDSWTGWERARSSTKSDRAQRLLMRGMDLPDKTVPAPEAPRARYRLMRFTEWLSRVREIRENGIETNLPPC